MRTLGPAREVNDLALLRLDRLPLGRSGSVGLIPRRTISSSLPAWGADVFWELGLRMAGLTEPAESVAPTAPQPLAAHRARSRPRCLTPLVRRVELDIPDVVAEVHDDLKG